MRVRLMVAACRGLLWSLAVQVSVFIVVAGLPMVALGDEDAVPQVMVGDRLQRDVATVAAGAPAVAAAVAAGTRTAQETVVLYQALGTTPVIITWDDKSVLMTATVYKVAGDALEPCQTYTGAVSQIRIDPAVLSCSDGSEGKKGGLVEIRLEKSGEVYAFVRTIPDTKNPLLMMGSDFGFGLTLIDAWADPEGSRLHEGASGYFALSKLRPDKYRVIAHLTLLDMMEDVDFELGVGVGLMYKPRPEQQTSNDGLAFALGVGHNVMRDDAEDGWYTFFGVNWNIDATDAGERAN